MLGCSRVQLEALCVKNDLPQASNGGDERQQHSDHDADLPKLTKNTAIEHRKNMNRSQEMSNQ